MDAIYMIRDGAFGSNYELKLVTILIGLFICWYAFRKEKNKEYSWFFLVSLVLAFILEFITVQTGTRHIVSASLFGMAIPNLVAVLIRVASEAAALSVAFLFIGDKVIVKNKRRTGIIILFALLIYILFLCLSFSLPVKDIAGDVASRRNMTMTSTIVVELLIFLIGLVWIFKTNELMRKRALSFLFIITLVTVFWTLMAYSTNTRWIEVSYENNYSQASTGITLMAFTWDILLGSSFLYLPFLFVASWLGLIGKKK